MLSSLSVAISFYFYKIRQFLSALKVLYVRAYILVYWCWEYFYIIKLILNWSYFHSFLFTLLGHLKIFQWVFIILRIKCKLIAMANKVLADCHSESLWSLPPPQTIALTDLPSSSCSPPGWISYFCLVWLICSFSFESHFKCHLLRENFPGHTSKVLCSVTVSSPSYFLQLHFSQSVVFWLVMYWLYSVCLAQPATRIKLHEMQHLVCSVHLCILRT